MPVLCGLVIGGLFNAVHLAWQPEEFDIISVSIDPTETDTLAARKTRLYRKRKLGHQRNGQTPRHGTSKQRLVLSHRKQSAIDSLISAVGFGVAPIPGTKDFAHSAAIILLSPDGTITRYLYGLQFNSFDLRTAILEA